ncbi:hypothetical protein Pelo_10158 [Pelomyxa schiedti]|nr:hypothetical protein Pelo_10158 [Pelomyxa schiedti]
MDGEEEIVWPEVPATISKPKTTTTTTSSSTTAAASTSAATTTTTEERSANTPTPIVTGGERANDGVCSATSTTSTTTSTTASARNMHLQVGGCEREPEEDEDMQESPRMKLPVVTPQDMMALLSCYRSGDIGKLSEFCVAGHCNSSIEFSDVEGRQFTVRLCQGVMGQPNDSHSSAEERDVTTLQQMQLLVAVLRALKPLSFPTVYPLYISSGTTCISYFAGMRAIIFPACSGTPLPEGPTSLVALHNLGVVIGTLHCSTQLLNESGIHLSGYSNGIPEMERFISSLRDSLFTAHPFINFLSDYINHLKPVLSNTALPKGFIHGNITPASVLFAGTTVSCLKNFEDVCHAEFLLDIAMAITSFCYASSEIIDRNLVAAFLSGYKESRPLRGEEANALTLALYISYVTLSKATRLFRQWNITTPEKTKADLYLRHVSRLKDITLKPDQFLFL